jgi:hypothetical protein
MDRLPERLDALEHHVQALQQETRTAKRRLRWWRGLAGGLVVLGLSTWALPVVTADDAKKGLEQRVAALETLLKHFRLDGNEVMITGANLRIVNGLGRTDCTGTQGEPIPECPNGLGNLIVGYNELRAPHDDGEDTNARGGSHNVAVGSFHNFSRFGGLVVGSFNEISGPFASVCGGTFNTASGPSSSVSGGQINTASGAASSVTGGWTNTASGDSSSISGGQVNTVSGGTASVSGGIFNIASQTAASVTGGRANTASGIESSVSGGALNTASGEVASVCGGQVNEARGSFSSVSGGDHNEASGFFASVSGGHYNEASGELSSVSGGENNLASGVKSSVSGGKDTEAAGEHASVSGGRDVIQDAKEGWAAGSIGGEVTGSFRSP